MRVELRNISDVKPYPNNPRINDHAVDTVVASIREFGFRQPIVVDEHAVIIVGHTRYKAALKLGLTEVPVHIALGLSPAQAIAYRIADNQSASLSFWDETRLPIELAELQKFDFDLANTGFSSEELLRLLEPLNPESATDPDHVPDPPDKPTTQPGDTWILGNHRVHCGDPSKPVDVAWLLAGQDIHLVNTATPSNLAVEPLSNKAIAAGLPTCPAEKKSYDQGFDVARDKPKRKATRKKTCGKNRPLINNVVSVEEFDRLLTAWFGNIARVLLPGHSFYIWGGVANCGNYPPVLKATGLYFSQTIVWVKKHAVRTPTDFMKNHGCSYYGWREDAAHRFFGPNNATDVWSVNHVNPPSKVQTERPVELAKRAIEYSSQQGENVLDLFGGSGSTLIAAEQTGRQAFLMEIDPLNCDVIVKRWERFTGKRATRLCATSS